MKTTGLSRIAEDTVLGLDLGVKSVGWCLLRVDGGHPTGIIDMGVRIFDAGMDGDVSTGQAESRAVARRQARQQRRMTERRARRKRNVLRVLQRAGLLPAGTPDELIPPLDQVLLKRHHGAAGAGAPALLAHVLPYWLRARALTQPLAPDELGRAFYHLAQRRGYLSNRRATGDKKDKGQVADGIAELTEEMERAGARTLGEYFAGLDPQQERIRRRWTSRPMFLDEFEQIWTAQAPHHPTVLTDALKARLHRAMFFQRPLRSMRHLVGPCPHEPKRKRCPIGLPIAQRFRLLQMVNNCEVVTDAGELRAFTDDERAALVEELERRGDRTFTQVKRLLKPFGFTTRYTFNFESGGEKRFVGNRTHAKLAAIFGDRWDSLDGATRAQLVEDVRSIVKPGTLERRGRDVYALDADAAGTLAAVELEDGYANLSRRAMEKLVPLMETGMRYPTAAKEVYGEFDPNTAVHDRLPPVGSMADLRNPVVSRVLSELRKVVNAVIVRHGKPGFIRIELARDLRRNIRQRQEATARNRRQEAVREKAAKRIAAEVGIQNPRRDDILKVLLADECAWKCPYTGRSISMGTLFGANPRFDIEHIIPFSRSLDDSFFNKTLCYHEENRQRKGNRTPYEAYAGDAGRWAEILDRVGRFTGDAATEKLRRFQMDELPAMEDFISTQLNDTRQASKLAMRFLATLYGGLWDASGTRRIQASRGGVTAYIREMFGLNGILNDGDVKSRDDHRHHAVDAVTIGLTTPRMIQLLSETAVRNVERGDVRARFRQLAEPWEGFLPELREAVDGIIVSHRVNHGLNGPLHLETNFAAVPDGDGGTTYRVRKPLARLSARDLKRIVDPAVAQAVRAKLDELGVGPDKAFADEANLPYLLRSDGRRVPIRRARVDVSDNPYPIGRKGRQRHVVSASNHHMEIVAVLDADGSETKWEGHLVSRLEAMRRKRQGEAVVRRNHGKDRRFKFSIAPGDTMKLGKPQGRPELLLVRSASQEQNGSTRLEFSAIRDARKKADIKKTKQWFIITPNALRRLDAKKVTVTPLGEPFYAND